MAAHKPWKTFPREGVVPTTGSLDPSDRADAHLTRAITELHHHNPRDVDWLVTTVQVDDRFLSGANDSSVKVSVKELSLLARHGKFPGFPGAENKPPDFRFPIFHYPPPLLYLKTWKPGQDVTQKGRQSTARK